MDQQPGIMAHRMEDTTQCPQCGRKRKVLRNQKLAGHTLIVTCHHCAKTYQHVVGQAQINMVVERIARACHIVNRAYCQAIGDNSQLTWEDAPEEIKESARAGVRMHMKNPEATPEMSHESWMKQKAADGWVWGPVKDMERKQHPCMVPYDQLPQEQRVKDYLFKAMVESSKPVGPKS